MIERKDDLLMTGSNCQVSMLTTISTISTTMFVKPSRIVLRHSTTQDGNRNSNCYICAHMASNHDVLSKWTLKRLSILILSITYSKIYIHPINIRGAKARQSIYNGVSNTLRTTKFGNRMEHSKQYLLRPDCAFSMQVQECVTCENVVYVYKC